MNDPRHYAVIDLFNSKVTVKVGDVMVAESIKAFNLKEVGKTLFDQVLYIPKEDVAMNVLALEEGRTTHCPIKGDATYWSYKNIASPDYFAWSYDNPLPRSKKITGYFAFNLNHVTLTIQPK
jgi:uncharacterized protein (DUF427 family)